MAATLRTRKFMTNRLLGRKQFVSGPLLALGGLCTVCVAYLVASSLHVAPRCEPR